MGILVQTLRSSPIHFPGSATRSDSTSGRSAPVARVSRSVYRSRGHAVVQPASPRAFPLGSWTIWPKWHRLSGRKRELRLEAVYGRGFAATCLRAMELITILNRCHHFPGLCLPARPLQCRSQEHRDRRAAAQGFGGGLFALPSAGTRLRPTRRDGDSSSFLSGDFSFFCSTPCGESIAAAARRSSSRKFPGATASVP